MASLRPQFFCTRPNGTLTPLIAVDDLPSHISIRGVPRILSPNDTHGMTSLGTVSPRAQSYVVEGMPPALTRPSSANAASHRPRDYDLQASLMRMAADESAPASQRMAVNALLQQGIAQNWCVASPSSNGWMVPNNGGGGGSRQGGHYNTKKEFCSYWIRHGECDYQQQGCLYKHEMPTDPGTLEKLGLRDIPRWYREKYGIPSLLPNGHAHPRSHITHAQNWKDDGADRGAMKSIQYPSRLEHNGTMDVFDAEKGSKHKAGNHLTSHHSPMASGHSRGMYISTGSPRGPGNQRHGSKNENKKIDLLSFDPLPEYPSLDAMGRNAGSLNYADAREGMSTENVDRTQREDMIRNIRSIMPPTMVASSDYASASIEAPPAQGRSKKASKSRRLYQPRSHGAVSDVGLDKADLDSFRTYHAHATASSSAASAVSKDTAGSIHASPVRGLEGAMSSSSPIRGASPSDHSGTSLSSESSPRGVRTRYSDKESKGLPAPIGSNKVQRKRSGESSSDDYYSMAVDYTK
ncbi:hypothetical protein ATEIFO6365_0006045400 [Aspergillus terreus]|uniref:Uncharacterized protein n=1 Tax=Aspergillus terreus TaxID=33178 RepID=A0A5M3YX17_ASPTE|nr:hypothetical protein ATETN484_0005045200 [Aspergillus terreus]GFF17117.1 hypothetical protein ATEIFO6365_0006045400 [Aspergillus terreus]